MRCLTLLLAGLAFLVSGCAATEWSVASKSEGWPVLPGEEASSKDEPGPPEGALPIAGSNGECYRYRVKKKTHTALLEWQIADEDEQKEGNEEEDKPEKEQVANPKVDAAGKKESGDEKKDEKNDVDRSDTEKKKNGNGKNDWEVQYEEPLQTDRPDFGAATTTVEQGRAILELGYTRFEDKGGGTNFLGHSYPDAVLRVGMLADWFEFRIGQTHANFRTTPVGGSLSGVPAEEPEKQSGFQDLYLGVKFALTEQKKYLPETAVIFQSTVPTGAQALTAGQMLPGAIYLFSWELGEKSPWSVSGLIEADRVLDQSDHFYVQVAQAINFKYQWTPRFATFCEWVGLYPAGAIDSGVGPQHYVHPGAMFLISNNVQLDVHAFIGVNEHAVDFFGGPGLSIRF